jgi:uncharacterized protein (TIGR03083 family)
MLDTERYLGQVQEATAALAAVVAGRDLGLPIPTCPDWTLKQLATHVGRAHRWAAEITRTRSSEFIAFGDVPDGAFPRQAADQAAWLTAGARRLGEAVREAGPTVVWGFGTQWPATLWGRRMCHETVVHVADAQLAAGRQPVIPADVAADGIDEWLTVITGAIWDWSDRRTAALAPGQSLHVHVTGDDLAGGGEWLVAREPDDVRVTRAHGKGDVALTGPADVLLLVLLRRLPPDDERLTVYGDRAVLTRWLAETSF